MAPEKQICGTEVKTDSVNKYRAKGYALFARAIGVQARESLAPRRRGRRDFSASPFLGEITSSLGPIPPNFRLLSRLENVPERQGQQWAGFGADSNE